MSNLLSITDVNMNYLEDTPVLHNINFDVQASDKIAIIGETGSGKSTLLQIIAGLVEPVSGSVYYDGDRVKGPGEILIPGHPELAYLSQHFELPKFVRVEEILQNPFGLSGEETYRIYKACDIAHLLQQDTRSLSGGEKQRVALGRLLLLLPDVLLLDEPFSNLDVRHKSIMKEVVKNVNKELSTTILLVSHDPKDVLSWSDKIIVLEKGSIVQIGKPKELYNHPSSMYVAGLFGGFSLLDPKIWQLKIHGRSMLNDKILIRPEGFSLSKENITNVKGEVIQIQYAGEFDEMEISVFGESILVYAQVGKYAIGDKVYVSC